ncbi:MAG: superoxide dismutase, partial [Gemmatimonadota bacterium]
SPEIYPAVRDSLDGQANLQAMTIDELLGNLSAVPEASRGAVRNNGGGHWNHTLFWELMAPGGAKEPAGALAAAINSAFGGLGQFKEQFQKAGMTRFGSGWAWLVQDKSGKLAIESTPNQDTPIMEGKHAVIGCDVWEHAYYLKYQNRRADYLGAWWNVVNWTVAGARLKS